MDTSLAVAFAGTPSFALPALEAIAASKHRLVVVYTQPDRRAGRGRELAASPVKKRALSLGLPVEQPASLREPQVLAGLAGHAPDVMVVVAYGLLLPQAILDAPRCGCLNIHASLLPRWRGAAPVARAIEAGDPVTGVCIMRMEAGLDTGPVMLRRQRPIGPGDTAGELEARLATDGAEQIVLAIDALAGGRARFEPQDPAGITYARKLQKSEARIRLERTGGRDRAPGPRAESQAGCGDAARGPAVTGLAGPVVAARAAGARPGTILAAGAEGIVVMTGRNALGIERLQSPGRNAVSAADFANTRDLVGLVLD